ncbi:MAG: hypothetical protein E7273_14650 [Pseudobutyrivibrio ruminis]|nr:hypothetical protein [Pseudobutyrivibrio ruminis]
MLDYFSNYPVIKEYVKEFVNLNNVLKRKIILAPYGSYGKLMEEVLCDFGVRIDFIIDNNLCTYNEKKFKSIDYCNKVDDKEYAVIYTSNNEELRYSIKQNLPNSIFFDYFKKYSDNHIVWLQNF